MIETTKDLNIEIAHISHYDHIPTKINKLHKLLKDNFSYISDNLQYKEEMEFRGILDHWRVDVLDNGKKVNGDCDDFALTMLRMCNIAYIPTSNLYIAVCHAYTGEGHAIPIIKDETGNLWSADNMVLAPIPTYFQFNSCGYFVSEYSGAIMRLDRQQWREFIPKLIKKPKVL